MAGGSRTPSRYDWRARRLRVALTPEDWRYVESGAMHRGYSVSRFLGDIVAAWCVDQRFKGDRIDRMVKGRGMIVPAEVP